MSEQGSSGRPLSYYKARFERLMFSRPFMWAAFSGSEASLGISWSPSELSSDVLPEWPVIVIDGEASPRSRGTDTLRRWWEAYMVGVSDGGASDVAKKSEDVSVHKNAFLSAAPGEVVYDESGTPLGVLLWRGKWFLRRAGYVEVEEPLYERLRREIGKSMLPGSPMVSVSDAARAAERVVEKMREEAS